MVMASGSGERRTIASAVLQSVSNAMQQPFPNLFRDLNNMLVNLPRMFSLKLLVCLSLVDVLLPVTLCNLKVYRKVLLIRIFLLVPQVSSVENGLCSSSLRIILVISVPT